MRVGEGGGRDWGGSEPSAERLFHAESTESRGNVDYATSSKFSEAVGRATRGMDRETLGFTSAVRH